MDRLGYRTTDVEYARDARRLRPGLPILFTSGYTEEAVLREGRLEPGFELIPKPFNRRVLSQKIREALRAGARRNPPEQG